MNEHLILQRLGLTQKTVARLVSPLNLTPEIIARYVVHIEPPLSPAEIEAILQEKTRNERKFWPSRLNSAPA